MSRAQTERCGKDAVRGKLRAVLLNLLISMALGTGLPLCGEAEVLYQPHTGIESQQQLVTFTNCRHQLSMIMRAAEVWANDNADQPPPDLQTLAADAPDPAVLFCPAVYRPFTPTNWADVDWSHIDYEWLVGVDWTEPTNVACTCRTHAGEALVDGSVRGKGFRSGWPAVTASPHDIYATPGETVRFESRVAPDTFLPVNYQWRKTAFNYITNVTQIRDLENPTTFISVTNVTTQIIGTDLPGQTNSWLQLSGVQTNDSGSYDVVLSNRLGATLSREAALRVSPSYSGMTTNRAWLEDACTARLKEIWLVAKLWASDNNNLLPQSSTEVLNSWGEPAFGWPLALFCPADTNRAPQTWAEVDLSGTSYEIVGGERPNPFDVFCQCRVHGFYVTMDGVAMSKPLLKGITLLPGGTVEIAVRTFSGASNALEASEDLVHWTSISEFGSEPLEIRFTDLAVEKRRFYRVGLR